MRFSIIIGLIFSSLCLFAQEKSELDNRGGFKEIKLMSDVSLYPDLEFKKNFKDERYPNAKLFKNKKGAYGQVGLLKVFGIEVYTYKDQVYEIIVEVEKSVGMYRGLVEAFGEPKYSHRAEKNYWHSKNIRLNYSINKKDRIVLEYYSLAMEEVRKEEKRKNLENLVDDF